MDMLETVDQKANCQASKFLQQTVTAVVLQWMILMHMVIRTACDSTELVHSSATVISVRVTCDVAAGGEGGERGGGWKSSDISKNSRMAHN